MERDTNTTLPSDSEKPYFSDREDVQYYRKGPGKDDEQAARPASGPAPDTADVDPQPKDPTPTPGPAPSGPPASQGPIPDGGTAAWLQILGSWVVLVATWGLVNTYGVFQTYYQTVLLKSSSSSSISWIGSLQASLLMLVGVIAGPLYDAGHFRHLLVSGLFLIVFGLFMTSLGTEYWHILLAQGVCIGAGMGLTFLPSTAILSQYFTSKRAFAIGIASTGSPLAGILFPIIFSRLVQSVGFGWATRVIAFVLLGLSAIPVAFMRTRVPPSGRTRALVDTDALRDPAFVLFVLASTSMFLCLYTAFFYVQLFDELHRLSTLGLAPYTVTLLNAGSVFGRIVPNYLADRLGNVNVIVACASASSILLYGWLGIHNLAGLVVFVLLYGAFSGGIVSVTPSAILSLSPNMGLVGTWMGMTFTLTGVAILVGTPIAGAILGGFTETEWLGVIGYSAGGLTVGVVLYVASRVVLYKRNGKKVA
ncbi:Riboflavin transporter MCH5 [Cytospora mali]|uniref:Riboflavin transporter MCH5 n=1 Tax=Cytospora mali TaxID=578113 RepID=A0A194VC87_CYTMA|nr:Riboflavin transporter MCH5 [Valsa mali var. pyri (nom. inval.)]